MIPLLWWNDWEEDDLVGEHCDEQEQEQGSDCNKYDHRDIIYVDRIEHFVVACNLSTRCDKRTAVGVILLPSAARELQVNLTSDSLSGCVVELIHASWGVEHVPVCSDECPALDHCNEDAGTVQLGVSVNHLWKCSNDDEYGLVILCNGVYEC